MCQCWISPDLLRGVLCLGMGLENTLYWQCAPGQKLGMAASEYEAVEINGGSLHYRAEHLLPSIHLGFVCYLLKCWFCNLHLFTTTNCYI